MVETTKEKPQINQYMSAQKNIISEERKNQSFLENSQGFTIKDLEVESGKSHNKPNDRQP